MTVALPSTEVTDALNTEFQTLFLEFAGTYLKGTEGEAHLAKYQPIRIAARSAYEELCKQSDAGSLDTDRVLLQLLPWSESEANRKRGAWTHVAPAITGDLKSWFENVGWTKGGDWPAIGRAILLFIRSCVEDPSKLETACSSFASSPSALGERSADR
jgi:5-methylcytosine-specific restriction protein B